MIGFANKGNAKRTLINNFEENKDFIIKKDDEKQLLRREKLGGSGILHEKVLLNVDTFKMLCMLAKTDKGKKIRSYYVKLENINNKILKQQMEESNKKLIEKENELQENQNELQQKDKELIENQQKNKRNVENTLKYSFNKRKVVYLIKIYKNDNLYKFGFTDDIITRVRTHKNKISNDIELIYCIESEDNKQLEYELKEYLNKYSFRTNKIINNNSQTELFNINDINIIKNKLIELNDNIHDDKLTILKLKTQIIDLERKLLKPEHDKMIELQNIIFNLQKENLELKEKMINLKISNQNEHNEIIKKQDIVEDRIHKKLKVDKIDPETLTIIETYECINAIIINNPNEDYTYNQLYRSIKSNNIYRNFRWNYHGLKIQPTNKEMEIGNKIEKILKLNKQNDEVIKIYQNKTEIINELKTHGGKFNKILDNKIVIDGHYYITEEEYKLNYDISNETYKELNKNYVMFNCKKIKETNIDTNEIIIYNSMQEAWEKRGIARSSLTSMIKNNRICGGKYKFEYVDPSQNKMNSKTIKETNQETNEIIIYKSMSNVTKNREISADKLRYCIRNNIEFNGYTYEQI